MHVIEGATGGDRQYSQGEAPFDYPALKAAYAAAGGRGAWIANNDYGKVDAEAAVASGHAAQLVVLQQLLRPGDEIIAARKLYGGSINQFTHADRKSTRLNSSH